jgi:hypothetical protein
MPFFVDLLLERHRVGLHDMRIFKGKGLAQFGLIINKDRRTVYTPASIQIVFTATLFTILKPIAKATRYQLARSRILTRTLTLRTEMLEYYSLSVDNSPKSLV